MVDKVFLSTIFALTLLLSIAVLRSSYVHFYERESPIVSAFSSLYCRRDTESLIAYWQLYVGSCRGDWHFGVYNFYTSCDKNGGHTNQWKVLPIWPLSTTD